MAFTSNIMIVRHRLLKELVKLWNNNELVDKIDRLPIELSPKRSKHAGRCCVHKERAVWKTSHCRFWDSIWRTRRMS